MLPIGDDNRDRTTTPFINYLIIIGNILVFLLLQDFGTNEIFTYSFSLVPEEIVSGEDIITGDRVLVDPISGQRLQVTGLQPTPFSVYLTFITSMFMHGSLAHIFGNMLFLFVFGRKVENQLDMQNYIAFYLISGVTASMAHAMIDPTSPIPVIGASGAISGVLGAFLIYNYKARITLLPDPVLLYVLVRYLRRFTRRFPAWIFLPIWFGIQMVEGLKPEHSGVAFWAHIGGFLMGATMAIVVYKYIPKDRFQTTQKKYPTRSRF
ncbi:MAG: rhomboid family intramembrane serine protease [Nanoarchaeota archaeon]|nr:rhomboid family intramembrane serine protease [Nanoarchaeota archaeon]